MSSFGDALPHYLPITCLTGINGIKTLKAFVCVVTALSLCRAEQK